MSLRDALKTILHTGRSASPIVISTTSDAIQLSLSSPAQEKSIPWNSIRRIVVFKRDVFANDLLCLAIELEPQAVLELDESMNGWRELIEQLPRHLPGALPAEEWLQRAAFPAFELSPIEIYRLQ